MHGCATHRSREPTDEEFPVMSQRKDFPSKRSTGVRGNLPEGTGASRKPTGFRAPAEEKDYLGSGSTLQPCDHLTSPNSRDKWAVNRPGKGKY